MKNRSSQIQYIIYDVNQICDGVKSHFYRENSIRALLDEKWRLEFPKISYFSNSSYAIFEGKKEEVRFPLK